MKFPSLSEALNAPPRQSGSLEENARDNPLLHFSARQDVVIWPLEDA